MGPCLYGPLCPLRPYWRTGPINRRTLLIDREAVALACELMPTDKLVAFALDIIHRRVELKSELPDKRSPQRDLRRYVSPPEDFIDPLFTMAGREYTLEHWRHKDQYIRDCHQCEHKVRLRKIADKKRRDLAVKLDAIEKKIIGWEDIEAPDPGDVPHGGYLLRKYEEEYKEAARRAERARWAKDPADPE